MCSNDNEPGPGAPIPDPTVSHGRAALLLVESLIHGLRENDTLNAAEAIAIAERALDVQRDYAEAAEGMKMQELRALTLLQSIRASLLVDESAAPGRD